MDTLSSLFLGVVQGITEFLPISSSGHLVVTQNLLGFSEPEILFDTALHLGTLLAVFVFFRSDLKKMILETWNLFTGYFKKNEPLSSIKEKPHAILAAWVIIGTLPTVLIGLIFKDSLEALFGKVHWVGGMLILTGLIIGITRILSPGYTKRKNVGLLTALAVGTAQGLAIIPGISRSGSTIVCGMLCGMERELAARFSFLLSIPAIAGAMVLQLVSHDLETIAFIPILTGFLSAAITGFIALKILMKMVKKGNLAWFAPYCWAVGLYVVFLL
ncbi:undecaprenyl-diphosphate phosphatase [Thermodesulfobacteriota bacterium]